MQRFRAQTGSRRHHCKHNEANAASGCTEQQETNICFMICTSRRRTARTGQQAAAVCRRERSSAAVMSLMAGWEFATSTTSAPPRSISLAKGIMPSTTSAPAHSSASDGHMRQCTHTLLHLWKVKHGGNDTYREWLNMPAHGIKPLVPCL